MSDNPPLNRRQLSRELTAASRATAGQLINRVGPDRERRAYRIGFTGPPGAGKSTLIAQLAAARAESEARVGVLAIDPSSPLSGGSILGDRIRMDEVADSPDLFIRSLPSRWAHDGLTGNVAEMLQIMDRHHFDEVFLETVGVGQTDHAVKALVDTVVLVLVPESGDSIQAMKAGILEMADVYVVNKSDRPNAERIVGEIEGVLALSTGSRRGWQPPVVTTSATRNELGDLLGALASHRAWTEANRDDLAWRRRAERHHVQSVLNQQIAEIAEQAPVELFDASGAEIYAHFLTHLTPPGD